jgi:hypothetical protein
VGINIHGKEAFNKQNMPDFELNTITGSGADLNFMIIVVLELTFVVEETVD